MRNLLAIALLIFGGYFSITTIPNVGNPPKIAVQAPTPESVSQAIKQEKLQKLYDAAARIAGRVYQSHRCNPEFSNLTGQMAVDFRVPVRVVAAVVVVESTCNPLAISPSKDVGLMQLNIKYHPFPLQKLLEPRFNMAEGTRTLADFIRSYGLIEGLHHYNGLRNPTNAYAEHVLRVAGYSS